MTRVVAQTLLSQRHSLKHFIGRYLLIWKPTLKECRLGAIHA